MPKKSNHEHDITARLALFAAIVFMITVALVFALSKIGNVERGEEQAPPQEVDRPAVIVGEGGITKSICERGGGYWIECGNPCHGSGEEVCIQVCEPQCLCGGSDEWACPVNFHCSDYEFLASDEVEIGVCRPGAVMEDEDVGEEISEPIREAPEGMICDDLNFICVDEAVSGSLLASPFEVSGTGIAFENTINWRLLDANGKELERGFVTADAPDIGRPGKFTIRAFMLNVPETANGTLEVLEYSAKDGSPTHVVSIPVRLPQQTMSIRYFVKEADAFPSGETRDIECSEVFMNEAIVPRSVLPVETSLRYLLENSLWETVYQYSAVPEGTQLVSLAVSGGVARVVFSQELENYGGGSCNVAAIRAQIEQTLKQFSSVERVEISVPGKSPEETLQP